MGVDLKSGCRPDWRVCTWAVVISMTLSGCGIKQFIPPGRLPYEQLTTTYRNTNLKQSTTLDVLRTIQSQQETLNPKYVGTELVNQSDTLVASSGQSKNKAKSWFTLFAFDEQAMTAKRKYFFCLDEETTVTPTTPQKVLFPPRKSLVFNSQIVLTDMPTQNYPSEQARDIALLKYIADNLSNDVRYFDAASHRSENGNHILAVSGMFMNSVFQQALLQLDQSPSLAFDLGRNGLVFDHSTLNKGRVQMILQGDILVSRVEIGLPM